MQIYGIDLAMEKFDVLHAYIASFAVFAVFGSIQQHKFQPIQKGPIEGVKIDIPTLLIVVCILLAIILVHVVGFSIRILFALRDTLLRCL